jgi:toxin ParE1/3/4
LIVTYHPLAEADLFGLYEYIEERSGAVRAGGYIDRIEALCANLASLPDRGAPRDDLAPGICTLAMERRIIVIYRVTEDAVVILRVLDAGRDFGIEDLPL